MSIIQLTPWHLTMSSILVFLLAFLSWRNDLVVEKPLLTAAARTTIQLSLIGLVLKAVFTSTSFYLVMFIWVLMLFAAAREVMARQKVSAKGSARFFIGASSMLVSSFSIMVLILSLVIRVEP